MNKEKNQKTPHATWYYYYISVEIEIKTKNYNILIVLRDDEQYLNYYILFQTSNHWEETTEEKAKEYLCKDYALPIKLNALVDVEKTDWFWQMYLQQNIVKL